MKRLTLAILAGAMLFIISTAIFEFPEVVHNFIYGIMAIFAILFLIIKRKDFEIDTMFDKKEKETEG